VTDGAGHRTSLRSAARAARRVAAHPSDRRPAATFLGEEYGVYVTTRDSVAERRQQDDTSPRTRASPTALLDCWRAR
jgi:hypothetical protein